MDGINNNDFYSQHVNKNQEKEVHSLTTGLPPMHQNLSSFAQQQQLQQLGIQDHEGNPFGLQQMLNDVQPQNDLHLEEKKTGSKRKRPQTNGSRKRRKIDPKDKRYKEVIVRFIFRNLDRPIHSTYVSKCATHKKNATIVKEVFWELEKKNFCSVEKWRETENSSLFLYKNEALNEKSKEFQEQLLIQLCKEYGLERSDVADGFRVPTRGPSFKSSINTGRWSKEEHEAFIQGLAEYGRTNYRLIAQNFVKTRITQQVAEYSERYFAAKRKKEKEQILNGVTTQATQNIQNVQQNPMGLIPQQILQLQQLQQMQQVAMINPQLAQTFQSQIQALQQQVNQYQNTQQFDHQVMNGQMDFTDLVNNNSIPGLNNLIEKGYVQSLVNGMVEGQQHQGQGQNLVEDDDKKKEEAEDLNQLHAQQFQLQQQQEQLMQEQQLRELQQQQHINQQQLVQQIQQPNLDINLNVQNISGEEALQNQLNHIQLNHLQMNDEQLLNNVLQNRLVNSNVTYQNEEDNHQE